MHLRILKNSDLESVLELFCECYTSDPYYQLLFAGCDDLAAAMKDSFKNSISFCLDKGICVGIFNEEKLIAFTLLFEYKKTRDNHKAAFNEMLGIDNEKQLPYYESFHKKIESLKGEVLYLLSIAVSDDYRQYGLASGLIDYILQNYREYNIVADVSNEDSLKMYEKRCFQVSTIKDKYFYVEHKQGLPSSKIDFSNTMRLLVPDCKVLDLHDIRYTIEKETRYLVGYEKKSGGNMECFIKHSGSVAVGSVVLVEYASLLKYQRLLNTSQVLECTCGDILYYEHKIEYSEPPLTNQLLTDMVKVRQTEWSLVPDVFVSVPVQYTDREKLTRLCEDDVAEALLSDMDFRTHYEAGVPSAMDRVDDLAGFKKRIKRSYLGKLKIQIFSEITPNNYANVGDAIGPGAYVDLYISVDTESNCAVLTWYSLSAPFLISHLFDNIIRNQIMVVGTDSCVNFYDYIKAQFGLVKRGTPKIFSVFPCDKGKLTKSQMASLLVGETIYPEGEAFGKLIDEDILSIVQSDYGLGQYDRAFVCAYSNSVLQFSEDFSGSISDRLCEESITLFYIELILFEEAAIRIADREIINLFTSGDAEKPVEFLSKVDAIYNSYSKTIDFWDIKVNYPTSQKSIAMLRRAFRIKEQLNDMKRNQEQLRMVFDTKCGIIDRKDSKRMDTSLAIISVLAIFSAWIDGYDYIATWNDVLSQSSIHILQRLLFVIILVTAGYVVTHLFGGKIGLFLRKRRERNCRRAKKRRK